MGENPAVGSANGSCSGAAMAKLDWLVVRDLQRSRRRRSGSDGPEIETGELRTEDIETEVFFLPAAAHAEKDGTFTNTQRLLQWHDKAVEPPGDCRSELWFTYHLGRRIREKLAGSTDDRGPAAARPHLGLPDSTGRRASPSAEAVLREINGYRTPTASALSALHRAEGRRLDRVRLLDLLRRLRRRGQPGRAPQAAREQDGVAPEWGWAWPANRRILYNRASADPDGTPWSRAQELRLVGRRAGQVDRARRAGLHRRTGPPDYGPSRAPRAATRSAATSRSSCRPTGEAGSSRRPGLVDGPLPTHYEPHESPVAQPALRAAGATRAAQALRPRRQPDQPPSDSDGASRTSSRPTG